MSFQKASNVTYFAAIMDIIGGPREFNSYNVYVEDFELFPKQTYHYAFTDDTVLTMAVARTLREARGKNDEEFLRNAVLNIKSFAKQYPNGLFSGGYGTNFGKWAVTPGTDVIKTKQPSYGNGSAMRVSSVGWAYDSLEKTLQVAKLTAVTSHAHEEGVKGAQAIASAVYLARAGVGKEDIKSYIEGKFGYDLNRSLDDIRRYNKEDLRQQSEFCQVTVPMALCAFLNGESFEDCGRKAVSIGGDSDTIGAMVGSIAGAFYGMPKWLEQECDRRMNFHMRREAKAFQDHINSIDNTPNKEEIEIALANARVEQHALRQYREKSQTLPRNDEKYIELLAERESVRLFYEEVNKARKNQDLQTASALKENKADVLEKIKEYVKNSADFKKKCAKMDKWPGKTERIPDCDWKKRNDYNPYAKPPQPQRYVDVDRLNQKLIPVNMVKNTKDFQKLMAPMTEEAIQNMAKKEHLIYKVDTLARKDSAMNGAEAKDEAFYQDIIDKLITADGEIGKRFPAGKNELLDEILKDLQTMKKEAELAKNIPGKVGEEVADTKEATSKLGTYDPLKLGEKALQKMQELSEALMRKAIKMDDMSAGYETLTKQLASIEKLSNAVEAWCSASEKRLIAEKEQAAAPKVPDTMDDMKRRYEAQEREYSGYMTDGMKGRNFYSVSAVATILGKETEALFREDAQFTLLETAARQLADRDPNAAMKTLEKLFEETNEKLMNADEPAANASQKEKDEYALMQKQVSYVNHLMSMVDDVLKAPSDGSILAQANKASEENRAVSKGKLADVSAGTKRYTKLSGLSQQLTSQAEAVGDTMRGIDNKNGAEYDLAERAQGALLKMRDLVVDVTASGKDQKLNQLKEAANTELATIILHQTVRTSIVAAAAGAKNTTSPILDELNKKGAAAMINELKETPVFKRFEESMTLDKLAEFMRRSPALMNAYVDFTARDALRRADEEAQAVAAENARAAAENARAAAENAKAAAEKPAQKVNEQAASEEDDFEDESLDGSFVDDLYF